MSQEIESVRPILTVIDDDGDLILSSTGPRGKAMAQAVLAQTAAARRVTIIADGEMKVMKRTGGGAQAAPAQTAPASAVAPARRLSTPAPAPATPAEPDIQDQYVADLESGATGEQAMGEQPQPTPGPNDPVAVPQPQPQPRRRRPQIFQDAAAPPAPELAEQQMAEMIAEAAAAEKDAAAAAEQTRYQRQQAVQQGQEAADIPAEDPATAAAPRPRRREPRSLATTGRPCGRCGGGGQVVGEAGFAGACPVCHGDGSVKTWDRGLKVGR